MQILLGSFAYAREPVKLAVLTASPPSRIDAIVLTEVYRRAGIPLRLITMPGLRASAEADSGRIDGEVARVSSYGKQYPNLIRVEPPIDALTVSAYFKKSLNAQIKTRDDLKKYSIGYVRGLKVPAELVMNFPRVLDTQSSKSLVQMLNADRFEVIVNNNSSTDFYINQMGLKNIEKVELRHEPLHHYLHKKHSDLARIISATITQMIQSGELAKLLKQAEYEVLSGIEKTPE
ncbi:substrate-binding periplasmic protein [Chitinibacter sp. S2-10]|uniref:substrate-binding periplasmic protein n=1 Tax=Chitinibacter sp. S2-10 TaxID=3373597 RepID=UPI00397786F8